MTNRDYEAKEDNSELRDRFGAEMERVKREGQTINRASEGAKNSWEKMSLKGSDIEGKWIWMEMTF